MADKPIKKNIEGSPRQFNGSQESIPHSPPSDVKAVSGKPRKK